MSSAAVHGQGGHLPRFSYRDRSVVFYVVVAAGLLAIVTGKHSLVLPGGLASQIGHNSEALCFVLLLGPVIQFMRPIPERRGFTMSGAAGAIFILIGILLLQSDFSASVVTLNEPFIAAGVVALYTLLPRPVRLPWLYAGAVLLFIVALFETDLVLNQAETLVAVMIAPVALDVMDRQILEGAAHDAPRRRLLWCLALAVFAVAMLLAASVVRDGGLSGPIDYGIDYAHRAAEAYWGWLLMSLYFSYWLARFTHRWASPQEDVSARSS